MIQRSSAPEGWRSSLSRGTAKPRMVASIEMSSTGRVRATRARFSPARPRPLAPSSAIAWSVTLVFYSRTLTSR